MKMFVIKANSTGKPRPKQTQLTRTTECFTCPKLQQNNMHKRDFEKSQPIKIKQLLDQCENLKHTKKDNVRKKMQPERLGVLSSVKKIKINEKANGVYTSIQSGHSTKHVQRYLNFDAISIHNSKTKSENKNQLNVFTHKKPIDKEDSETIRKRSLLIPPNTIKHKYLQKYSVETNRCSKISKVSNALMSEPNIHTAVKEEIMKVNNTNSAKSLVVSQCTSPKPVINNENQLYVESDAFSNKNILCEINDRKVSTHPESADNCIQDLCSNLQDTKLVSESDMNINHESEMIYVSKDKILRLECNLKDLLNVAEENMQKLRLASACITEMLLTNDERNSIPNIDLEKNHIGRGTGSIIMVDKAVQVKTCGKEVQYAEEQVKIPILHTPKIMVTDMQILNKKILVRNDESNKENENVDIRMSNSTDGSFLELESQLNIAHVKSVHNYPNRPKTPTIAKFKQKRSLMEYMALKSSISFLETPDGKKFKSLCQVDGTDKSVLNVRSISNKLLTDLHNLYSESPET